MKNKSLIQDYLDRGKIRLEILQIFFEKEAYADVVREAQEIVELLSKALIRFLGAEPARVHDASTQLEELKSRLASEQQLALDQLIKISKELRRDRELAFYGAEDLTPSEFYSKKDASEAISSANIVVQFVCGVIKST